MPDPSPPSSVAVIVVNYGTADLTIAGVQSVLDRAHGGRAVEVHLLDNASPGDDAARLAEAHAARGWGDRVTLYPEAENHGFGRGNNVVLRALAARATPPAFVFLLNPDARLDNEAIDILARTLEADPRAGFAGAGVAKPDGTAVTAAFRFPTPASEFAQGLSFGPVARLLRHRTVALPPDTPAGPVDWVVGAAVMMRWPALAQVGFFDPAYFLYYEEVDLMLQGRRAGYHCLYVPQARVVHAEGAATGVKSGQPQRRRKPGYWYQSWRHYYRKNHGRTGLALAVMAAGLGSAGGLALGLLPGRGTQVPRHFFADLWTHVIWPRKAPEARTHAG